MKYLSKLAHSPVRERCFLMKSFSLWRVFFEERHREIAGQNVVERRNIGRTLNRSMAAQRQNSAARAADIAQQQLQDRRGANDLHALGMLGPADGIADGCGLVRARC